MTNEEAFKILAVENLAGFGLTATAEDLPDLQSMGAVIGRIATWWNGHDQLTRDILTEIDVTDALWNAGWLYEWPGLYTLMSGNPFGRFADSLEDIRLSMTNARDRAGDYAAQHAVGRLEDDPALQAEAGN